MSSKASSERANIKSLTCASSLIKEVSPSARATVRVMDFLLGEF